MASEIELKFALSGDFPSRDELFSCEDIAPFSSSVRKIHMKTEYLDTAENDAKARGITLRRRFENGESVIYAKCKKSADGALSVRGEWSINSDNLRDCVSLLAEVGAPVGELCGAELQPCAAVEFERFECEVTPQPGFSFALSYDEGFFANDRKKSFREIELELICGEVSQLVQFGEKLSEKFRLVAEPRSKYARAILNKEG